MTTPPHLPPLGTRYEREPVRVHKFYGSFPMDAPALYSAYKVKDGDTLSNVAVRAGVSVKHLMSIAFGTNIPQEINWYLRNKVGCKKYGSAKKNYAFSSSADPGLIWLENHAYKRLVIATRPAAHTFRIARPLPSYPQKNGQGCWAVAVANLYDWKKLKRRTGTKAVYEIGKKWGMKYDAKKSMQGLEFKQFAADAGLKPFPYFGDFLDDNHWMKVIKRGNPFLIVKKSIGNWLHWLIVVGYELKANGELWIKVYDAGDSRLHSMEVGSLYEQSLTANPHCSRMYGI